MNALTLEQALKIIEEETNKIEQMTRDIEGTRFEDLLYSEDIIRTCPAPVDQMFI